VTTLTPSTMTLVRLLHSWHNGDFLPGRTVGLVSLRRHELGRKMVWALFTRFDMMEETSLHGWGRVVVVRSRRKGSRQRRKGPSDVSCLLRALVVCWGHHKVGWLTSLHGIRISSSKGSRRTTIMSSLHGRISTLMAKRTIFPNTE